jgi:Leucine-rich repeat (LRR) protein
MKNMFSFIRTTPSSLIAAVLLAAVLLAGWTAKAQVVNFPDPNLDQAVRDALQIYSPTNIYQTNLLALTNFSANGSGIVDLTGLQYATNLTVFELEGRFGQPSLTNISVLANFRKLTRLDIVYNRITNASPVAGLTNLVYLDIGWNRDATDNSIRDISFLTNLRRLQWMSLFYLRINDLGPLAGLTSLTNLNVSYNYTATNAGALNALTNMAELYATAIGLNDITFVSHMPNLTRLDFGSCNVTNLSPALGRNLVGLWAYYNPLTNALLVTNFTTLTVLHMENTGLTNVSSLSRLTKLQELSLDNNPGIANLSFLNGLTNLTYLSVGQLPLLTSVTVLSGLTNLTELHLHDDTNLTSITPLVGLTNLNNLDLNNCPSVNFTAVTNLVNLNWLHLDGNGLQAAPFVLALPNLYGLSLDYDRFTSLDSLAGAQLGELHVYGNRLGDIGALVPMNTLNYLDIRNNYLDISPASVAWNVITNIQNRFIYDPSYNPVDYSPQSRTTTLTIFDQPADQCISVGGSAYFAVSASSIAGSVQVQWQFNNVDLVAQTNTALLLTGVVSNQAGIYRAVLQDDNGGLLSAPANLYVGDPNCGRTVAITQQPVNAVAAPGEDVSFSVVATTTLTNLYYQWLFYGTNISGGNVSGDTSDTLTLSAVDFSASGIYQVLVWDDSSNVVASTAVQLKVVDVVPFTDPSLSNQVVSALGFSPGTTVHLTDLDNLNYLYVNNQGITNISGLECARYLYALDLGNNQISDPSPLGWLYALQYLYLDNCGLQDASFVSSLTNLYQLSMNNNTIHSIPDMQALGGNLNWLEINYNGPLIYAFRLASVTNLYHLGLHDDGLPDIAFTAGMTQLQSLDVGGDWIEDPNRNYVSDISPLTGKTAMNWLSLSFDQVTNVPIVAAFTNVTSLYLSSNHFGNLNFITNMPNLNTLAINYSTVTNLAPLTNHTLLGYLDVGYIATTNLSYVSGLINLSQLWAGGNHAGGAGALSNLTSLQVLGFDQNGVRDLSPLTGLTSLFYLNLENNQATNASVIANRTTLTSLYLAGNQIHDLTPLSGLTNVQWLSLGGNGFTNAAPLTNLHALIWLTMQSNYVQNITPLAGLTNLYYALDLSANQITDMSPLTNLHALTWLGMWQNKMTNLPSLVGLSNVTSLDFWGNQLTNAAGVSGMTQLNWLGLSRNNFTTIQTLTGLPNLTSLELYSNHLADVSGIAGLTSLNWLYLHDDNLSNIHPLTSLTYLYYVDLRGNWLNTNTTSAAMADIAVLQSHNTYVDYIPQNSLLLALPARAGVNQFQFSVLSPPGDVVQILKSGDLNSWTSLGLFTNTTGTNIFTDSSATGTSRFYRAQQ